MTGRRGGAKLVWVLVIGVLAVVALAVVVVLVGAGAWFFSATQPVLPELAPTEVPTPAELAAPQNVPPPPASFKPPAAATAPLVTPPPVTSQAPGSAADIEQARAAMMQYGSDRENYPYRVDNVQVRGNRAIGNYTPVKRDGSVDEERPGGLFVAHKVNGRWSVYALGTDIIDPWAEPITRIYGDA